MEVWNEIRKKILVWNRRILVWNGNGMAENCLYGIWKNRFPFHSIPCPDENSYKIALFVSLWFQLKC